MEEWKKYKLSEIGQIVGGATPSTSKEEYYGGKISWITPKDLSVFNNGRYIQQGERNITQEGLNSCSSQLLPKGSILFSSRAPIGYVAITKGELCTNQGFKSIIPNTELIDNIFLYYLLKYEKERIEGMGSGTIFKEVSGAVMRSMEVTIPTLSIQKKIANILDCLDSKIELNRQVNDNLSVNTGMVGIVNSCPQIFNRTFSNSYTLLSMTPPAPPILLNFEVAFLMILSLFAAKYFSENSDESAPVSILKSTASPSASN